MPIAPLSSKAIASGRRDVQIKSNVKLHRLGISMELIPINALSCIFLQYLGNVKIEVKATQNSKANSSEG